MSKHATPKATLRPDKQTLIIRFQEMSTQLFYRHKDLPPCQPEDAAIARHDVTHAMRKAGAHATDTDIAYLDRGHSIIVLTLSTDPRTTPNLPDMIRNAPVAYRQENGTPFPKIDYRPDR